ncbi:SpoIIE family protein phosphatase [Frigoribacterium sp. CFBP 13707]|uniref:PP2C family protein-serine/threonine phosphatase n=1 Tax=Frigoribacterium sp. CFBP 13707 TaxID=2775313 RepID=UPI001787301C|nr:serine/threonine-protein phosphatase [Frigoribacterium sp. CFBP 13707]
MTSDRSPSRARRSSTLDTFLLRYGVTPLVKQAPSALLVVLAVVLSLTVPQLVVTSGAGLLVALGVTAVATLWAAAATARPAVIGGWALLVPALDFVALGVLRWSTGSSSSVFTALLVMPLVWFAAREPRRSVLWAVLGSMVVILTPFIAGISAGDRVTELARLLVGVLVYTALALVVNELSRQYAAQLRLSEEREAVVRTEITRAAEVQRSLLPGALADTPGYALAGTCLPSTTVGGDFFDWYRTDDGVAMTLGDVMGKGVGAGLIAAAVRATVRSSRRDPDPGAAIVRASEGLATDLADGPDSVVFTTLFHARLRGDVLHWADAGHGLTVVVREDGGAERLSTPDLPIGLGLGLHDAWETRTTALCPGDLVVCFSDGVLDLFGGGLDSVEHVAALARRDPRPSAVVDALADLARELGHDDDVTVVALRREPVAAPVAGDVLAPVAVAAPTAP